MFAIKPAHEQKHVRTIFKRMFSRSEVNLCSCRWYAKVVYNGDKTEPLSFQKVEPKSRQLGVTWFEHIVMPSRMEKCQFQPVLLHPKE